MPADALDDQIMYHIDKKRAPDDILWPAVIAMWKRIGSDCVVDYIWFAAKGEHMDERCEHGWGTPTDSFRAEAIEYLDSILGSRP